MNEASKYVKLVEWSEEDKCFVGSCPGLIYGGCHGEDEQLVFAELCRIVEETIQLYSEEGKSLPAPTSGYDFANMILSHTVNPTNNS
jgi:predicted RNase H-like HicB family nuclease